MMDERLVVNVLYNDSVPFYDKHVDNFVKRAVFTGEGVGTGGGVATGGVGTGGAGTGGSVSFNDLSCPSWKKEVFLFTGKERESPMTLIQMT